MPLDNSVKDNNNLVDYNIWSGTDYSKTTSGVTVSNDVSVYSSTENSYNGDYSLKGKVTGNGNSKWFRIRIDCTNENLSNLQASIRILTPNNAQLFINQFDGTSQVKTKDVMINASDNWQLISIEDALDSNTIYILMHVSFYANQGEECFTDDWKCLVQ